MNSPMELVGSAVGEAPSGEWQVITREVPRSQPTVVGYVFDNGNHCFALVTRDGIAVRAINGFRFDYELAKSDLWRLLYQEVDGWPPQRVPRREPETSGSEKHYVVALTSHGQAGPVDVTHLTHEEKEVVADQLMARLHEAEDDANKGSTAP